MENVDQPANKNHCHPSWVTVCPISPHISTLVIKRLVECAFVSPSVVAVAAAAAVVPEPVATATVSTETPSPAASEPSSVTTVTTAKASVTTVTELLLLQLWQLCGHSELPTATVLPCFLMEEQVWRQRISNRTASLLKYIFSLFFHIYKKSTTYVEQMLGLLLFPPESPWLYQLGRQNKLPVRKTISMRWRVFQCLCQTDMVTYVHSY